MSEVSIRKASPFEVSHLFEASTKHFQALYPSESNHLLDLEEFEHEGALLLGASAHDQIVGCVGMIPQPEPDHGEIKRLFVEPSWRSQGIARRLMQSLEAEATRIAIATLQLETGSKDHRALALYRSLGFKECGPFGNYVLDPHSVFMTKTLLP